MTPRRSLAVLGAGSWGTALAILLAGNGHRVVLWGRDPAHMRDLRERGENSRYLPGIALPGGLEPTDSIDRALAADIPLIAVPSGGFRDLLVRHATVLAEKRGVAWATKGLEERSHCLLQQVAREALGERVPLAVISGPNFAGEVARRIPTATTVASDNIEFARELVDCLHNDWFRAYRSDDPVAVQLGGALKNALAIASGISDGLGFGANTRAALLTRGLAEITRLTVCLGGRAETLTGLAGIGDLLLTCTDNQSRNRRFGLLLAGGKTPDQALDEIGQAVEGVKTVRAAYELAHEQTVDMPIIEQVYRVLFERVPPMTAVRDLLARDPKPENQV